MNCIEKQGTEDDIKLIRGLINFGKLDHKCNDYTDWRDVGFAIYNTDNTETGLELFDLFSQRSSNYDENGVKLQWSKFNNKCGNPLTIASLRMWSRGNDKPVEKVDAKPVEEVDTKPIEKVDTKSVEEVDAEPVEEVDELFDINKFYEIENVFKFTDDEIKSLKEKIESETDDKVITLHKKKLKVLEKEVKDNSLNLSFDIKKEYFEKFVTKILYPLLFAIKTKDGFVIVKKQTLQDTYENLNSGRFIDMWLKSPTIKTKNKADYLPFPLKCDEETLNLFTGLDGEKLLVKYKNEIFKMSNISVFIKHLWVLVGKNNGALEYCLNFIAHAVQRPGELPNTAIVFKSNQGTGKNLFFENLVEKLFGVKYLLVTEKMEHIVGRFSQVNQKLFVIMDETNSSNSFSASDSIKFIITSKRLVYEKKGKDGFDINNCGRYIFFSNNDYPIKIEQSDRRFVVFECCDDFKNDAKYVKALLKEFDDEVKMKQLYEFFKNRDISNFKPTQDRPITSIYKEIQTATTPIHIRFLTDKYEEEWKDQKTEYIYFDNDQNNINLKSAELYNSYLFWNSNNNKKYKPVTKTALIRKIFNDVGEHFKTKTERFIRLRHDKIKSIIDKKEDDEFEIETYDDFNEMYL
jgi:hypothetical protein